jgi:tyrosyl-tRNA synthetase
MNAMVPGLQGGKMSASEANSKIDFLDSAKDISKKINSAEAVEGKAEGNGLLAFAEAVLFPISSLRASNSLSTPFVSQDAPEGTLFSIPRPDQYGGPIHYADYTALHDDYASKKLHPGDLKLGIKSALTTLLAPIRKEYEDDPSFQEIEKLAYPPPEEPPKKKKEKKVNPRFLPGGQDAGKDKVPKVPEADSAKKADEAVSVSGSALHKSRRAGSDSRDTTRMR